MTNTSKAHLYLLLMTIFWGMTFPIIKNAVAEIDAYTFVSVRFSIAALLLFPFIAKKLLATNKQLIWGGIVLGLLNSGAYTLQTVGLEYIDSARCAFITGTSVVMVPFLAHLFKLAVLNTLDIICAGICLIGLFILTGASFYEIDVGEIITFLCAISVALSIIYLQTLTKNVAEYKLLCFYQILFTVPLPLLLSLHSIHYAALWHTQIIFALLFCAFFATIWGMLLQTKYQKFTSANKAAMIFSLEPVFACLFGVLLIGEQLTSNIILGGRHYVNQYYCTGNK